MSNDIQSNEDIADLVRRVRIGLDEAEWAIRNDLRPGSPGVAMRLRLYSAGLVDAADGLEASLNA